MNVSPTQKKKKNNSWSCHDLGKADLFAVGTRPPQGGKGHCPQSSGQAQMQSEWGLSHAEGRVWWLFFFFFFFFLGYRIVVHSFQAKEPSGHQTNLRYAGTTA